MARRILVTGSGTFFAARLIHDLVRRGCEVTTADSRRWSPGKAVKGVARKIDVPVLATDPEGYLNAILAELDARPYDLLLPLFEESLLLAEHRYEICQRTRLFLPPFETMQQLHHKPSLDTLCGKIGIPSPPTVAAPDLERLQTAAGRMGYPVVLKLPMSNNSVGRTYCASADEFAASFGKLSASQQARGAEPPFVQKRIDGDPVFTLCYCQKGRKYAEVIYRTRRTFPQDGGTAAHRESIEHPAISAITAKLVRATEWTGFLGLDFLVDRSDGTPWLIDANPRANPAIQLGFLSGLDWSQLILNQLPGGTLERQIAKPGVHAHARLLDIGWLLEGLIPGRASLLKFPARLARFIRPEWPVASRGDLLEIGEYGSFAAVTFHSLYGFAKSLRTGRQIGDILLEDSNYDPVTAAALRSRSSGSTSIRRTA